MMLDPSAANSTPLSALEMSRAADSEAADGQFEVGKVYHTRGGRRTVEILAIRTELRQPIIGLETHQDGDTDLQCYWPDGRFALNRERTSLDLLPHTDSAAALDFATQCLRTAVEQLAVAAALSGTRAQLRLSLVKSEIDTQLRAISHIREDVQ